MFLWETAAVCADLELQNETAMIFVPAQRSTPTTPEWENPPWSGAFFDGASRARTGDLLIAKRDGVRG